MSACLERRGEFSISFIHYPGTIIDCIIQHERGGVGQEREKERAFGRRGRVREFGVRFGLIWILGLK